LQQWFLQYPRPAMAAAGRNSPPDKTIGSNM
jgi:hypothetical protein